jgi:CheY-like chemotaxis protein
MDCQMPQMDGFEATRIIKQSPHHGHIPIIGITADILRADNAKCFAAGMDDYFHKPLAIHTLEQLLHKWLASKTVQGAAAP